MSTISSITPSYSPQSGGNVFSQRRSEIQQLSSAIQSGDLNAAQQVLSQLQSSMSGYGASAATSATQSQGSPFQQMISQVGSALQSGNLSAAQQTLNSFQQLAASGTGGHHHHRHGGSAGNATASAANDRHQEIVAIMQTRKEFVHNRASLRGW
jgi:ribosomal protein S20